MRIRNQIRNAWSDPDLEAKINVSDPKLTAGRIWIRNTNLIGHKGMTVVIMQIKKTGLYSVFLTPPMTAGRQSAAHLSIELKTRLMPMSLGFSRPRMARCFITLTNSLQSKIITQRSQILRDKTSLFNGSKSSPKQKLLLNFHKIPCNKKSYSTPTKSPQQKSISQRSQIPSNKHHYSTFANPLSQKLLLSAHKFPATEILTNLVSVFTHVTIVNNTNIPSCKTLVSKYCQKLKQSFFSSLRIKFHRIKIKSRVLLDEDLERFVVIQTKLRKRMKIFFYSQIRSVFFRPQRRTFTL